MQSIFPGNIHMLLENDKRQCPSSLACLPFAYSFPHFWDNQCNSYYLNTAYEHSNQQVLGRNGGNFGQIVKCTEIRKEHLWRESTQLDGP